MEIRFSQAFEDTWRPVEAACKETGFHPRLASIGEDYVRFSLPGVSEAGHDRVIRALLTLDPDATVRTARAVYSGLQDFEKQRGKA